VKTELEDVVNKVLSDLGLDLVEFRTVGSRRRPVFDIRIEKIDGEKVTVDDCANVSRILKQYLDSEEAALDDYVLEVSSPGLERPLKRTADWRRFVGRTVSVSSPELGGRRELDLVGVEPSAEEGEAEVAVFKDKKGADVRLPLAVIREARLVFNWKR
jgi:ribosome maturation factor RimP